MRIVYNLRDQNWETTKSLGVLHVSLRVLEGLSSLPGIERIDVLANRSLANRLPTSDAARRICRFHGLTTPSPTGWSRVIWDHWSVVRQSNALAPDWLLLPKGFSPLARWPKALVSAYVHDTVFAHYAELGRSPFPAGESALFSRSLARTVRRADSIVTNSSFTSDEVMRLGPARSRPIRIGAPVPERSGTTRPASDALLLLTSTWPHKLTAQAIAWLERWQDETSSPRHIHGVGSLPAERNWPKRERWHFHGRMDEPAFANLWAESAALIYFSAYEGYGLPPIEAGIEGMRAIASDLPALRETMPLDSLFSNSDYTSFRRTLDRVLEAPAVPPRVTESSVDVARRWFAELTRVNTRAN